MRRHHRGNCGPGPERGFSGQRARVHRGRGHLVGCRPGTCVCGPVNPSDEALGSLWRRVQRHQPDCLVFQGHIRVRRHHGHQILDANHVQRLHELARA
jgi:hypothetical protein